MAASQARPRMAHPKLSAESAGRRKMFTSWTQARSSANMHGLSRALFKAFALGAVSMGGSSCSIGNSLGGLLPRQDPS